MSIEPAKLNFTIWKGGTFSHRITYYAGADATTPLVNLSGYSASATIHDVPNGATLLTMTTVNSMIVLGGVGGTIDLIIPSATTTALTWTTGVYELFITSPASVTDVLLYGSLAVKSL